MSCHALNCVKPMSGEVWEEPKLEDICKDPKRTFATLDEMARHYQQTREGPTSDWLDSLSNGQPQNLWITNFICGEANRLEHPADGKFCKNSHQYRMPSDTVIKAREVFSQLDLAKLTTFADIYAAVREAALAGEVYAGIHQFGDLATYDFSLRYAWSRGILPERVYLHAGAKTGFDHLQRIYPELQPTRDKIQGLTVDSSTFPNELAKMEPLHIENFLCIYADHLKALADNNKMR